MRAVVFDLSLAKYGLAKAFGKVAPQLHYGRGSCLQLRDVPEPSLPKGSPDWTKLRILAAGVCGSDIATVMFKFSPSLSPFSTFPCVLGHEIVAVVEEVGAEAHAAGFREGDRVVVNPAIGCVVRGVSPCAACARGLWGSCHRAGRHNGHFGAGLSLGYHAELPGGFSEKIVAHRLQLHRVKEGVPDERAVLSEPLAIGLHAVLRRPPKEGERILIIGGGMIAYAVLAALRARGFSNHVTQVVLLEYQGALGKKLGADDILLGKSGAALLEAAVQTTGATRHKPILGADVLTGGWELVYDCIGAPSSVRDSLAVTASQGTFVLLGGAAEVGALDLTPIWSKEVTVLGASWYGPEPSVGEKHTLDLVGETLPGAAFLDELVTHRFALEDYSRAMVANLDRAGTKSVKTLFRP